MDLSIQKLSKAFNHHSVFSDLSFLVQEGGRFAITGANGSGKSTLLKILSGAALPTSGKISYSINGNIIEADKVFRHVHFVAPYNTVIEELNLREIFSLHRKMGMLLHYEDFADWNSRLAYAFNADQQIRMFSSGMKQRIRLALALLDTRPLILLDEPGSNLDQNGKAWLRQLIDQLSSHQTLIIASNDPEEITFSTGRVHLEPR